MAQVKLDSLEIKHFLKHIIDNNRYLQENNKVPIAVEIMGEAGLGKTTVIKDIAETHGLHFVKLNLSMLDELGD